MRVVGDALPATIHSRLPVPRTGDTGHRLDHALDAADLEPREVVELWLAPGRQLGELLFRGEPQGLEQGQHQDGQGARALPVLVLALLEALGLAAEEELAELAAWRKPKLHNFAGLEVGRIEGVVQPVSRVSSSWDREA